MPSLWIPAKKPGTTRVRLPHNAARPADLTHSRTAISTHVVHKSAPHPQQTTLLSTRIFHRPIRANTSGAQPLVHTIHTAYNKQLTIYL